MHSPLPDSRALESGILEDDRPSRMSTVHDNVRCLLRNSVLPSMRGSIMISPPPGLARSRPEVPFADAHADPSARSALPISNAAMISVQTRPAAAGTSSCQVNGRLFPPLRPDHKDRNKAQLSGTTLLNEHPDLRRKSFVEFLQYRARVAHGSRRKKYVERHVPAHHLRYRSRRQWIMHGLICAFATLLLGAIVATCMFRSLASACRHRTDIALADIALNANNPALPTSFHIVFVLGIIFAMILFTHSVLRMCLFGNSRNNTAKFHIVSKPTQRRRRRRRPTDPAETSRAEEAVFDDNDVDLVHDSSDPARDTANAVAEEVRPDSRDAHPMAGVELPPQDWDKDIRAIANPPPAYGRWRGSIRIDPLQWKTRSSDASSPQTPAVPSPTYEETMTAPTTTSPPTYISRDSPRSRPQLIIGDAHPALFVQPEMIQKDKLDSIAS